MDSVPVFYVLSFAFADCRLYPVFYYAKSIQAHAKQYPKNVRVLKYITEWKKYFEREARQNVKRQKSLKWKMKSWAELFKENEKNSSLIFWNLAIGQNFVLRAFCVYRNGKTTLH